MVGSVLEGGVVAPEEGTGNSEVGHVAGGQEKSARPTRVFSQLLFELPVRPRISAEKL
jgi:hypothetical protein